MSFELCLFYLLQFSCHTLLKQKFLKKKKKTLDKPSFPLLLTATFYSVLDRYFHQQLFNKWQNNDTQATQPLQGRLKLTHCHQLTSQAILLIRIRNEINECKRCTCLVSTSFLLTVFKGDLFLFILLTANNALRIPFSGQVR